MTPNSSEWRDRSTYLVAVLAGAAAVAGSYAAAGYTPAWVVAPVEAFLTRTVPDVVLRFAVTTLGTFAGIDHFGQLLNLALAVTLAAGILAGASFAAIALSRRLDVGPASVALVGGSAWVVTAVLTGRLGSAVGAAVAAAAVVAAAELAAATGSTATDDDAAGRRRLLGGVATALGVGVVGYLVGGSSSDRAEASTATAGASARSDRSDAGGSVGPVGDPDVTERYLAMADRRTLDVEGLEGLVSDDFYQVDINNVDPNLRAADWTLSVTGNVERAVSFTYEELTSMAEEQRFVTLRCVSDRINGKLMDTDLWTGVPASELLSSVNPQGEYVMLRAADGYYEEFPLEALEDALLAYGKRGGPLPRAHGRPVRALVPGHWGEINVKWLTEIEVLDGPEKGFWEKRGWHGTGPVNTVAKLHATERLDGEIRVAGHAYAGTRGIERVEVSVDGGESWADATLSEPLPAGTDETGEAAEDAWRQWEHRYENPGRRHDVVVRATDGTGAVQPREEEEPYPSGATGWVSKTVSP